MIINLVKRNYYSNTYVAKTSYLRLVPKPSVTKDGVIGHSQSVYESYDFPAYASQFRSSDFDIQSLLSVGAFDMLKPTFVSTLSSMEFADKFQNLELPKSE